MDTEMHDLNLRAITSRLNYNPSSTAEAEAKAIFTPKAALIVPTATQFCNDDKISKALGKGDLVIENKVTKKRIRSNGKYHIATPTSTGEWEYCKAKNTLKDITNALASGSFVVSIDPKTNSSVTIFYPGEEASLIAYEDIRDKWNALCAAAINYEIEQNCYWNTNGSYQNALAKLVGNDRVEANDDYNVEPLCMVEYTMMVLNRVLESTFNTVFDFISVDRSAFYNASEVAQGVMVRRYTDVRAFIWHIEKEEQQRLHELALEEGKVGNY